MKPAKASKAVSILETAESDGFDQLITLQLRRWRFGFGKISPVSSLTPAVRYEIPRLGSSPLSLRVSGAYSVRGYQAYDLKLGIFDVPAPYGFAGHGFLGAPFEFDHRTQEPPQKFLYGDFRYENSPREEFYGIGPDSVQENRSGYRAEGAVFDLVGGVQFTRWLGFQARGGYVKTNVGRGTDDKRPDVQDLFPPSSVPGLEQQPDFLGWWHGPPLSRR